VTKGENSAIGQKGRDIRMYSQLSASRKKKLGEIKTSTELLPKEVKGKKKNSAKKNGAQRRWAAKEAVPGADSTQRRDGL